MKRTMMTGDSMMDDPMMMWAMGLFWILLLALMVLGIPALLKYLRS
tara:strand:+ start:115 stop:252 length:138 start_codon:yes stop_codon:yes gene_type:complete